MTRIYGWRGRLTAYIDAVRRLPFRPGDHDCALFAAGAVEAVTGEDPAADLRGKYRTIKAGGSRVEQLGYLDHVDMAAALFDRCERDAARVGDLVIADMPDGPALGVVGGPRCFFVGVGGLYTCDLLDPAVRTGLRVG